MIYNMGGMNIIQAAAGKNCHLKPQHYSAPHSIILLNENAVLLNIMKSCLITVHLLITPIRYADSLCYLFFNLWIHVLSFSSILSKWVVMYMSSGAGKYLSLDYTTGNTGFNSNLFWHLVYVRVIRLQLRLTQRTPGIIWWLWRVLLMWRWEEVMAHGRLSTLIVTGKLSMYDKLCWKKLLNIIGTLYSLFSMSSLYLTVIMCVYNVDMFCRFEWVRTQSVLGRSSAVVSWQTSDTEKAGMYRIRHSGYYKPIFSDPKSFTGVSRTFRVTDKSQARSSIHSYNPEHNRVHIFNPSE